MLEGFKKVFDGVQEIFDPINIMTTNLTDKNKEIAKGLIDSGFTTEQVQNFVDVSRPQLDPYLLECKVRYEVKQELIKEQETQKAK